MTPSTAFKKFVASLVAVSLLATSLLIPASQAAAATAGQYNTTWVNQPSFDGSFVVRVPQDNWTLLAEIQNSQGLRPSDPANAAGELWMVNGQEYAGLLGLTSSQIINSMASASEQPPWVVARFMPETAQLRINVIKVIKTRDGRQQVWAADYTPHHGQYSVKERHFLLPSEMRNPYQRGMDPYAKFRGADNDPTFYNVTSGSAQVALGMAMSRYRAVHGLFIESSVRLTQTQSTSGNFLKKRITTTTTGYVKPEFYLAQPPQMSPNINNVTPSMFALYCTRSTGCTDSSQIAFSGFVLDKLEGGNIPDIEEQVYQSVQSKSSFTGVAFMLVTAALTWGVGAMVTGTAGWAAGGGAVLSGSTAAAGSLALGAGQMAAIAGVGYASLNAVVNGGPLTSAQSGWLSQMGMQPSDVTDGTSTGSYCTTTHCQGLYSAAAARHIDSTAPGTTNSSNNLQATTQAVQGNCPVSWTVAQCNANGMTSGVIARADSHPNNARTALMYKRREAGCRQAGYTAQADLYKCMAMNPN